MSGRDTIVAPATAPGRAGIGVLRLSGPRAFAIAETLCGQAPQPGRARRARFHAADGSLLDDGLLLAFAAPRSFTGEDVVELHGHGNPLLLAAVQARCIALGARAARPGEFSERAFLEGKLDLAQAEAVADLIAAGSEAALRAARRSLEGVFSARVDELVEALTALRVQVEAGIDFPEEAIEPLAGAALAGHWQAARALHAALAADAARGARLVDGLHVVLVGAPNAGKSALLNALAGAERAIVTPIPGTTRDLLREGLRLDGVELTLVDSAGLRDSADPVEAEGIRRARAEAAKADLRLAVLDDREADAAMARLAAEFAAERHAGVLWVHTHADLTGRVGAHEDRADGLHLWIDASRGEGLDALRQALREAAGDGDGAGVFSARARHLEAIARAGALLDAATAQWRAGQAELAAEDLRLAQDALGEITGRVSADALLGRVFASFCIGK